MAVLINQNDDVVRNEDQRESIKITKNSRGTNWEIRILSLDIDKLEQLNNEMQRRFGSGNIMAERDTEAD